MEFASFQSLGNETFLADYFGILVVFMPFFCYKEISIGMQSYLKKKVLVDPDQNKISWIEPILSEESLKVWIHDFLTKEEVDPIRISLL